ncbi:MAG TPA: VCBS repeat-containing protein, partial [Allocoleopsis sp.]
AFNGNAVRIIAGDFNGDGKTDVIRQEFAWVDGVRDTEVYLSNGNGTFRNPILMTNMKAFDGNKTKIITGDFNGDGKTDIIRQETGNWVDGVWDTQVYLSNGNGTFGNPIDMTDMAAFNGIVIPNKIAIQKNRCNTLLKSLKCGIIK